MKSLNFLRVRAAAVVPKANEKEGKFMPKAEEEHRTTNAQLTD